MAPAAERGVVPSPPSLPFLPSLPSHRPTETCERLQGCTLHLGLAMGVASNPLSCHFQDHLCLRPCHSPRFRGGPAWAPGSGPFPNPLGSMRPKHPMSHATGSHCAKAHMGVATLHPAQFRTQEGQAEHHTTGATTHREDIGIIIAHLQESLRAGRGVLGTLQGPRRGMLIAGQGMHENLTSGTVSVLHPCHCCPGFCLQSEPGESLPCPPCHGEAAGQCHSA